MCSIVSKMVDNISQLGNTAFDKGDIRFPKWGTLFFRCDTGIPRGET